MIKTKATDMGKTGGNVPAGETLVGTDRNRVGGQIPATPPVPAQASAFGYLAGAPALAMPNPQDSQTLPMFNESTGFSDTGVSHTGDVGGA